MDKPVFVLSHINERGIEAGHDFAHFANINVAYVDFVAGFVFVKFNKLLVLKQGYLDFVFGCGYD